MKPLETLKLEKNLFGKKTGLTFLMRQLKLKLTVSLLFPLLTQLSNLGKHNFRRLSVDEIIL